MKAYSYSYSYSYRTPSVPLHGRGAGRVAHLYTFFGSGCELWPRRISGGYALPWDASHSVRWAHFGLI